MAFFPYVRVKYFFWLSIIYVFACAEKVNKIHLVFYFYFYLNFWWFLFANRIFGLIRIGIVKANG
jgi:hypothetical protein